MAKRLFLSSVVLLLLLIGLLPLLSMFIGSLQSDGHFTLEAYEGLLRSPHQWELMQHSMILSSAVTLATTLFGVPLGLLFGKTDLPFRRFFALLFTLPLLIPPYIMAVSWSDLLGRDGLLKPLLGPSAIETIGSLLSGLSGSVFVLSSIFLPIPILFTLLFLKTIDPHLEEAGRVVSGWHGVLKGITIPLILPGIVLSALLVFLLSFGEFSVPAFLRFDVFPLESFTQFSAFYHFKAATAAAIPMALVALLLLLMESRFLRAHTYQLRPSLQTDTLPPIPLGKYRPWLLSAVAILVLILVLVPMVALLIQAGDPEIYHVALNRTGESLLRSLVYAVIGASLLTIFGFFTGYLIQTKSLPIWRSVDTLTLFLFALPGTVIGIGLIHLWNTPWTNIVYGTPMIIILGYLTKYTVLTSRITVRQLAQIPSSMEEAAQVAGAGWFRRMIYIVIPMAKCGLIGAWLVGYIFTMRDTGVTMLVYPAGEETLPVRIYTLMANGTPELIAALCIIMITTTLLPVAIVWTLSRQIRIYKKDQEGN